MTHLIKRTIFFLLITQTCVSFQILGQSNTSLFSKNISHNYNVKKKLDSFVNHYYKTKQFNGVVLVSYDGELLLKKSYGVFNNDSGKKLKTSDKFLVGSLTKSFTAITIMQFVEDGLLDLEVPISQYLPSLDKKLGNKLNIHHLLKMVSGLSPHLARLTQLQHKKVGKEELIDVINNSSLAYEPGSQYSYSSVNYTLLALILESVSGKSFEEIMNERTFKPLKMNSSRALSVDNISSEIAIGHTLRNKKLSRSSMNYISYALGSGNIYSSVDDLLKWDIALYQNQYLSKKSKELVFNGADAKSGFYGYGFRIMPYTRKPGVKRKGKLVRHGGRMHGFVSTFHRYLDDKITIIVLGNVRPFPIRDIAFGLKELVLGRKPEILMYQKTYLE